jgi:excisionase family DNA binding protein
MHPHGAQRGTGAMATTNSQFDKTSMALPSRKDAELATESSRILSAVSNDDEFRVQLEGGQQLVLPSSVRTLLVHLLTEMSRGNAVRIIPIHAVLTTQEAADFLNVSRPYVVGLLEKGEIAYHMVGTHRRIKFEHLSAFKQKQDRERNETMDEMVGQAQELDMGY